MLPDSLDFTAIDFETANGSSASACSVGLVKVRGGEIVARDYWLIQPPIGHDAFLEWNVRIHGIRAEDVVGALTWRQQLPFLLEFAEGGPMVAHNAGFDMGVIKAACTATGLDIPEFDYLCSLQLARKTYSLDSYKLTSVAEAVGYDAFEHHNALADSEACAAIILHAAKHHGAGSIRELATTAGVKLNRLGPARVAA